MAANDPQIHRRNAGDTGFEEVVGAEGVREAIAAVGSDEKGAANGVEQLMGNAIVLGDSLSGSNWPVSGFGQDWPSQLLTLSNWSGRANITNYATNSMTAQSVASNIATWSARMKCDEGVAFVFLGTNDYAARTSAQIFADLQTIWAACRAAGRLVVAFHTLATTSGGSTTVRNEVKALVAAASSEYDFLVDLSDLTSSDTVDGIHLTAAANLVVAGRVNTALGALWDEIVKPAQTWEGSSVFRRASLYVPSVNVKTESVALDLESDTNHPISTGLAADDVTVFPFPFPMERGLRVGIGNLQTAALLANTITLSGDFFVGAWVRLGSYSFGSTSASCTIIGNDGSGATGDFFGFTGSGGSGSLTNVRPQLRINSVDYTYPELPSLRVNVPAFVAFHRLGSLIYVSVNGVLPSKPTTNSGTITIDRLFHRAVAASIFVGDVFGIVVKSGTVSSREIQHWMRGGSASSIGGTTEAEWLFDEGAGAYPLDTSSNKRVINLSSASNWSWCFPTGRPVPGTSADNGNASVTLTVSNSYQTQLFNTPLTADRDVTPSTTGAAIGALFRIVRGAGATGAFNLRVGTGPLKVLSTASTWCDIQFNGTAYALVASGTL
jgi:lysophospholipase L1-like esterase